MIIIKILNKYTLLISINIRNTFFFAEVFLLSQINFSGDNLMMFDLRFLDKKLYSFKGNTGEIIKIESSPLSGSHFASSSFDRRIYVYDISLIG
jgi:hypothetical protein